ncbi:TIR domain-containing protein [bacterium]|nr:TIR domain-containing protein [bacterium]
MTRHPHVILCGGANPGAGGHGDAAIHRLEWRRGQAVVPNVRIGLPGFINSVYHLSARAKDLIEIASYIYCADRLIPRGHRDAVEYHSWGRNLEFWFRVRDFDFWSTSEAGQQLSDLLLFLSGEARVELRFERSTNDVPENLFDRPGCVCRTGSEVTLLSGGVDSLAGAVEQLSSTGGPVMLVSHRSQSSIARTQDGLIRALDERFPNRVTPVPFKCGLIGSSQHEETQRSRFLLYATIAFACASSVGTNRIHVYENGITSLNFARRQDLMNARASRTTHPRTIALLAELFSEVSGAPFSIETPFLWRTKTDTMALLRERGQSDLLSSSVSCSKTRKTGGQSTHCGGCSQCIDRRFSEYAAGLEDCDDAGFYAVDFVKQDVPDGRVKGAVIDYLQQASDFESYSQEEFYTRMVSELAMVVDWLPEADERETVQKLWELTKRHGRQVVDGLRRMREVADDRLRPSTRSTILKVIEDRDYLTTMRSPAPCAPPSRPVQVFISYSHKDRRLLDELLAQLSPLRRSKLVELWYDDRMGPGDEWRSEISEHLETAELVLLLVSADFIGSDYCYKVEAQRALERHQAGEATVVPVIIRDCVWQDLPFGALQALPTDGHPVSSRHWNRRDQAWSRIAQSLRQKTVSILAGRSG